MLTTVCRVLQKTLDLNRYASLPFVMTGQSNGTEQWLQGLRERLLALLAHVDRATAELASPPAETSQEWTNAERALFGEFLAHNYPNEASAGVIALGDAWKDGLQVGVSSRGADGRDAPTQFERLALSGLRRLVPYDPREAEWTYEVSDFLHGAEPHRNRRPAAIRGTAAVRAGKKLSAADFATIGAAIEAELPGSSRVGHAVLDESGTLTPEGVKLVHVIAGALPTEADCSTIA
ncbi:MAG: hypothetical protein KGQ57_00225 [Burkholderiales bacterium]|nr:hypothetical protein [Burkholderiales bacterium]